MPDLSPVVIAVCGLSVVCVGLVVIGAFLIARFTGGEILAPLLDALLGRDTNDHSAPAPAGTRRAGARSPGDLRSKAQSLDFDSAVEKYRRQGGASAGKPAPPPPRPRLSRRSADDESSGSLRRRSREDNPSIYDDESDEDLF